MCESIRVCCLKHNSSCVTLNACGSACQIVSQCVVYRCQQDRQLVSLFCVHNVSCLLTEAREDQPADDNLTPSDIKPNVNKFTDSSDNESYGKESKNKKAAKVRTVL